MDSLDERATYRHLKTLYPLCELSEDHRRRLARHGHAERLAPGSRISAEEDCIWFTYLIEGDITIVSDRGTQETLTAGTPRSKMPLFNIHPKELHAVTGSESLVLRFRKKTYQALLDKDRPVREGTHPDEIHIRVDAGVDSPLYAEIYRAYINNTLLLPSLPDVAMKIRQAMKDPSISVRDIAITVIADPALSGRLIQVANSVAYSGAQPVRSVTDALARMGLDTAHDLVLSLAMSQLFNTDSAAIKKRLGQLYEHSTLIASLCYVLARRVDGFNKERALLAGLVHDLGVIPILYYVGSHGRLLSSETELESAIAGLRSLTGHLVLSRLAFDPELIAVAEYAEDWQRDPQPQPDYCDIVNIAHLYSYLGTPAMHSVPRVDEIPAYGKLGLGEFNPKTAIKLLAEAKALASAIGTVTHR